MTKLWIIAWCRFGLDCIARERVGYGLASVEVLSGMLPVGYLGIS